MDCPSGQQGVRQACIIVIIIIIVILIIYLIWYCYNNSNTNTDCDNIQSKAKVAAIIAAKSQFQYANSSMVDYLPQSYDSTKLWGYRY